VSPINILVLNKLKEHHLEAITSAAPEAIVRTADLENAREYISDTEVLAVWGWMDIRPLFSAAPRLRWVHALTAGVENLIFPELTASSVILTNSRGIHGIPVSEHVFAMMLAFSRGLNTAIQQQKERLWKRVWADEIYEKTIGIVGLGGIGREIAKKAKGFGMEVVAAKREMTAEIFVDQLYPPDKLTDMLAISDYVVIALPLLEETRGLIRMEHFLAMKRSAYFINIARGAVVNEPDLIAALQQGIIKGAGLDVFEQEPLPADSPLWDMPNVIITPHQAALSPYYLDRAIKLFADDLSRFVQGREMFNVIDKTKGY